MMWHRLIFFVCLLSIVNVINSQATCDRGVRCQPGTKLISNPEHVPTSNGCGNPFISVQGTYDLSSCCDQHDICYDTCFSDKDKCDKEFQQCIDSLCTALGNVIFIF